MAQPPVATTAPAPATAKPARQRRAKMTINTEAKTVTFALFGPDGKTPHTDPRHIFVADYAKLPASMQLLLGLDRLRNKLMDSYSDPASDVIASCRETYDTLAAGNWAARGEGAERTSLFVEAYAAHHKMAVDVARTRINAIEAGDDADKKALLAQWRAHPAIKSAMARMAADRARERADAAATAARGATAGPIAAL